MPEPARAVRGILAIGIMSTLGCNNSDPGVTETGEFGVTGRASLSGMVVDSLQQPRDSFHVTVQIASPFAFHFVRSSETGRDGQFLVAVEQRAARLPGDSVAGVLQATSMRVADTLPDGSRQANRQPVWVHVAPPPQAPFPQSVMIVVPRRR